jgi:FMN phosphatase YigB (HAD superfamily)
LLTAIVISQRVGVIKPHRAIFDAARAELGEPRPEAILHVGDDWAADVIGAADAGWRTGWVRSRPPDTPLPTSEPDGSRSPDLELAMVTEVDRHLDPAPAMATPRP